MQLNFPYSLTTDFYGHSITLQSGLLAKQANSSVIATIGDTTVMAVVVIDSKASDLDYFPLQVIFEERLYASGKIKGSRFQKREGRPTDNAILMGRLVDRSLRSLFNQDLKNSIQVIITVLSVDEINQPDTVAVLAASTALQLAGIPYEYFKAPVSCAKIAFSEEFLVNPFYKDLVNPILDLTISSNAHGICMLEAGMDIAQEEILIEGIALGQEACAQLNQFQQDFVKSVGEIKPANLTVKSIAQEALDLIELDKEVITDLIYSHDYKTEKNESLENYLKEKTSIIEDEKAKKEYAKAFYSIVEKIIQKNVIAKDLRPDKRSLGEIRELSSNIDILPQVHGSSLFNRGQTQVMNVLTLGTMRDALLQDDMEDFEETTKRYLHHYNFPAYSVGEVGRYMGPSRRDIGHGNLAEKALRPVIPSEDEFPYTIRLVSECLGSNGSTSMASTCASSLSLMSGGVPIKTAVAGIAMGVIVDDNNPKNYRVLTDIQGMEDHFGHMDFKLTGTNTGLTALQLDNKLAGISLEILTDAIKQARIALDIILENMNKTIDKPKENISKNAPLVVSLQIPFDRVGEVIGSSGKVIKSIIARTNTQIDIEDNSGKTFIYGKTHEEVENAKNIILGILKEYELNEIISFTPRRLEKFGFIGSIEETDKETLLHVSQIPNNINLDDIPLDIPLKVKIIGFNDKKQMNITLKYGDNTSSNNSNNSSNSNSNNYPKKSIPSQNHNTQNKPEFRQESRSEFRPVSRPTPSRFPKPFMDDKLKPVKPVFEPKPVINFDKPKPQLNLED